MSTPAARTQLHLEVSFKKKYARLDTIGLLKNISLTGAFLEKSKHNLILGETLFVTFQVAQRERSLKAEVIWLNKLGVGIKFLPQNNQDVQIIDDLIYFVETKRLGQNEVLKNIFKNVG